MTSFARYKPVYVSMAQKNDGLKNKEDNDQYLVGTTPDSFINASASTQFNSPIVEKASDFLVAIERMELSLNGVPFYDASQVGGVYEQIIVRSRLIVASTATDVDISAFSLTHLFEILNSLIYVDPNNNQQFHITYSISKDGFVIVSLLDGRNFTNLQLEFPRRLNMILGISTAQQFATKTECDSSYSRIDLGDDLDHIVLQTNLPTNTDALGNVHLQVLTDFASPSAYSNSMGYGANGTLVRSNFSSNLRQKLIYTPTERRYLELIGDFPINNISIEAFYTNVDGDLKNVPLPLGGIFEVKIGFYLKQ